MSEIKPGDIVEWSSQSHGTVKTKRGKVIAVVPAQHSAFVHVPFYTPKSRIKINDDLSKFDRAVVEVKRGGKSQLCDYYAPKLKWLRKVEMDD